MIFKYLINKPLLPIGLLMFYILMHNLGKQGKLDYFFKREGVIPSSCRAVIVKLKRRIPQDWQLKCDRNNLHLVLTLDEKNLDPKAQLPAKNFYYRELANAFVSVAKNSPDDTLSRTGIVRITVNTPNYKIEAVSFGREVVKLAEISDTKIISAQLQKTVKIKEYKLDEKIPDYPPDLRLKRHQKNL